MHKSIMDSFMREALNEAKKGVRRSHGGPFGAVIVKDKKIIAKAHNEVIKNNDPTCHAEIQAIRKAAKKEKTFDLSSCTLYATGEPCPMCFGAIHWAKIKKVYFACDRKDAEKIGFDDKFIYDAIKGTAKRKKVMLQQIDRSKCLPLFNEWKEKEDKVQY